MTKILEGEKRKNWGRFFLKSNSRHDPKVKRVHRAVDKKGLRWNLKTVEEDKPGRWSGRVERQLERQCLESNRFKILNGNDFQTAIPCRSLGSSMRKIKTVSDMQDLKLYFPTPFLRKLLEDELHQDKKDAKSRKPEMPHWRELGGNSKVSRCVRRTQGSPERAQQARGPRRESSTRRNRLHARWNWMTYNKRWAAVKD